jgi:hypothetical protein
MEMAGFPVNEDFSLKRTGRVYTTENVHQCGFPSSIFSYNCMDFTLPDSKVDVIQGFYPGKMLGDVFHF